MEFKGDFLTLDSGTSVTFNYPVQEVLDVGELLVVLLATLATTQPLPDVRADISATKNRNVFGIAKADGRVIWQIPALAEDMDAPYIGMIVHPDGSLHVGAWKGVTVALDPLTGQEIGPRRWVK
ncbi:MAG: hypothetical protein ACYCUV_14645 [Phycisphaerae bacterium]